MKIAAAWAVIGLGGAAAGWSNYRAHESEMTTQIVRGVTRAAIAFDADEVQRLDPAEPGAPAYRAVTARLRKFKAVDPRVRSLHLLRLQPDSGRLIYLADASDRGPDEDSAVRAARLTAGARALQELLRTGEPATEGPQTGDNGAWITGWAMIEDTDGSRTQPAAKHVLAIELDATGWLRAQWLAWFEGAFYLWIVLGLPFAAWIVVRRQHEQREVIRNLSEAMEQSHSAIMILDLESRVEYANRGLCQQIGYSRRELIGHAWRDLHAGAETLPAEIMAIVRTGRPWEGEWFNKRKDGSAYPVRGVVSPVKHRDGSLACFVAVFDDVSETKGREAELREARDAALAGDRAKGQFLATMSHEVRTPLNGIVGFTSLLLETPLNPEQREYVQTIRMSTEALIQLTGDILDFARIESGKLKLDPLACDPREAIEDALDLMAAKAAEKKIELLHRVAADVPAAVITDGGRLRQVLVNLVGNAVKFTEAGEVEVTVRRAPPGAHAADRSNGSMPDEHETCVLEFNVRDTGIGIAPEHHAKLFRPFTQVDESTTRRYGGTGLGLAICRNLVELMGGRIQVASSPGQGSTFSFTLRVVVAAPLPPARDLHGLRCGLAVRSAPLRHELRDLMQEWGARVVAVDAPELLVGEDWSVALVEVCAESARALASSEPRGGLPAEKCCGLVPISLPNDLRTALRAHFRLLVNKPVHHDALFALLSGSLPGLTSAGAVTHFGFRVLIVEDNAVHQRVIQRVLANLGCTAKFVENGRLAIAHLADHPADYDLMLLDLHMPEMEGVTALRDIRAGRAGPRAQTMWIIAVTADVREQQRARSLEAGLNDYLTSPLNLSEVEAALKRFRSERLARKH